MKSILENVEVVNLPYFAVLGALNFVDLVNSTVQKVQI